MTLTGSVEFEHTHRLPTITARFARCTRTCGAQPPGSYVGLSAPGGVHML